MSEPPLFSWIDNFFYIVSQQQRQMPIVELNINDAMEV